jgi:hypothetical protein
MIELSLVDQEAPNSCITAYPSISFSSGVAPDDQNRLWKGCRQYIHYPNNMFPMKVLAEISTAIGELTITPRTSSELPVVNRAAWG